MKKILTIIFIFASLFASSQGLMNKNFEGFRVKVSELVIDNDTLNMSGTGGIEANSIDVDTVKINGVPLLLNTFKQGNLGGASNIFYSTGASSQPASGSVNQVIGGNLLTNTYLPLFNGTNFANSSISDNGALVNFSRSLIQMSGPLPGITTNTSDGADTKRLVLAGGGEASSNARGAYLYLAGNEYANNPGALVLASGNVTGSCIDFSPKSTPSMRVYPEYSEIFTNTGGILQLRRNNTSVSANNMIGKIQFYANDASTTTNMIVADIEAQATKTVSTDINPGRLIFRTTPTTVAATPIEAMRITENQYVGISTSTPSERLDVNGNIIGDTIKVRADLIVTGEIYDEINHLYGMVYDSTITLSLAQNVWQQVTNPTKTLYSTAEQNGVTISGDTIVFSKAGGYDVYFEINCTGIDSKDYHYRILQENGTTTVRSYNKYASNGTQVLRNEKAYIHVAAGSKVWCEIMSPSSAPGSITIQGAKVYAMQCYLEK